MMVRRAGDGILWPSGRHDGADHAMMVLSMVHNASYVPQMSGCKGILAHGFGILTDVGTFSGIDHAFSPNTHGGRLPRSADRSRDKKFLPSRGGHADLLYFWQIFRLSKGTKPSWLH